MYIKTELLVFKRFAALLTRQLNNGHCLDHLAAHTCCLKVALRLIRGNNNAEGRVILASCGASGEISPSKNKQVSLKHCVAKSLC